MEKKIRLLFVDDEEKFLEATTKRLTVRNIDVQSFTRGVDALEATKNQKFDVALLDLKMPGMDGEELLHEIKLLHPKMEVVILTGHGSIDSAKRLTRDGAYEYLQKPCELDELISILSQAYAKRIISVKENKARRVEEVLAKATGYSPMALLEELRKIDNEED
jgi:DNA-binding NtrC family response regulator